MKVLLWIDLAWRVLFELFSNQLVKYTSYGKCKSDQRLDGKVVVITGASAGIGKSASLLFTQRGAKVVMACRDLTKANNAIEDIKSRVPNADIDLVELELSSFESVRKCAQTIKQRYSVVDVLVNNGGLATRTKSRTSDGHEIHFQVNYLSHFLLTLLLLDNIKKSSNGKVVNVSSILHRLSPLDLNYLKLDKDYSPAILYGKSKLAQILFTKELAIRCPSIKTYALHPGAVKTDIHKVNGVKADGLSGWLQDIFWKSPENGAQTILHCVLDPKADQETGLYYVDCRTVRPSKEARSSEKAKELWEKSLDMVGLVEEDLSCNN